MKDVIVIGSGGHAKVVLDIIEKSGDRAIGILDKNRLKGVRCLAVKQTIWSDFEMAGIISLLESETITDGNFLRNHWMVYGIRQSILLPE